MGNPQLVSLCYCLIIYVTGSSGNRHCSGDTELPSKHGSISTNLTRPPMDYSFKLTNTTDLLILNVDIIIQHGSPNCQYAVEYLVMPDGSVRCFSGKFCAVYTSPVSNKSQVEKIFTNEFRESVGERCGATWITAKHWPPRICIKRRFDVFKVDISYHFFELKQTKDDTITVSVQQDSPIITPQNGISTSVIVIVVAIPTLTILLGVLMTYKCIQRRRATQTGSEIAPYAVHVSIRRGRGSEIQALENHYDIVEPGISIQETAYLQPIGESGYCEITSNTTTQPRRFNRNAPIYDMAEQVEGAAEITYTSLLGNPGPSSNDNIRHSGYVPMLVNSSPVHDLPASQYNSIESLTNAGTADTPYSEIVGTLSKEGSLDRFKQCEDKYKSVRKKQS